MDGAGKHGAYERTIAAWRGAAEAGDARAAARCLADDVEVISPLTAQFRFHGREQVTRMLEAAFEVVDDTRCHTSVGDGLPTRCFSTAGSAGSTSRRHNWCGSTQPG